MFRLFRKYRTSIATGTILFFVVAGTGFPLLECLHYCSHLTFSHPKDFKKHSYYSHHGEHVHSVLNLMATIKDGDHESPPVPVKETQDSEFKKLAKHFPASHCLLLALIARPQEVIYRELPLTIHFPSIPTQPPQV
ncbi:MAG: hypothetical protein R2830_22860 [Saprospiraceae bacterium]